MGDIEASQARRHFANALVPGVDQDFALRELTKAIELAPTFAEAYAKRALLDLFGGLKLPDWNRDMADAEKAIQLDPAIVEAYFVRGWIYSEYTDVEKRKRAIEDLKKVLELSPGFRVTLAHRDVVTGKMAVIGAKEIRQEISVLETQIQKRSMKELVEALVNATSMEQRWLVVGILTREHNLQEKYREVVADEEGINMLIEALGSQDSEICRAAAYVFRFWPDERAFNPLLRCVGVYGDRWSPQHADLALDCVEEKIGKFSAVTEMYTQALSDRDPAIREATSKRFQSHPWIHITWLDREGKDFRRRENAAKDTKPSVLLDGDQRIFLGTIRALHLPAKTVNGQRIEYLIQTEDNRYLDLNDTFEGNFKKLGIDTLSVNLKIVPREVQTSTPPTKRKFRIGGLLKF